MPQPDNRQDAITRLAYELRQMAGSMMRVADAVEDLKELSPGLEDPPPASITGEIINRSKDPDFEIIPARMIVSYRGFELEGITARQFRILDLLLRRPGIVRSRAEILEHIAPEDLDLEERTIDSHIKKIRRILEGVSPEAQRIRSVWGIGYKWQL